MPWTLYAWYSEELIKTWWCIYASVNSVIIGLISFAWFLFCWWHHNQLLMTSQWPDNCNAITWLVISNSLDIGFIHSDIHGRSCKNPHHPLHTNSCICFFLISVTKFNTTICQLLPVITVTVLSLGPLDHVDICLIMCSNYWRNCRKPFVNMPVVKIA